MQTQTQTPDLRSQMWINHHTNSYKEYFRTFAYTEFPEWVIKISEAINTGSMDSLRFFHGGKYIPVYEALAAESANSKSDTIC